MRLLSAQANPFKGAKEEGASRKAIRDAKKRIQ